MRRNLKEIFKEKWYSDDDIKTHYEYIKYKNNQNKLKYKEIEEKHKEEIEKAKKYFKKVKVSLKWDWIWCDNKYWRIFINFNDLEYSINLNNEKNIIKNSINKN